MQLGKDLIEKLYQLFKVFMDRWQNEKGIDFYSQGKKDAEDIPAKSNAVVPGKVEIEENFEIQAKYKKGWIEKIRDTAIVNEIVIHGTAGGSCKGIQNWMLGGERAKEYYRGIALFHYLVGRDGEIVQIINPNYWVYHSSSGKHDKETIGIELVNNSAKNDNPYTEKQYKALYKLIFDELFVKFPITRICTHNYNVMKYAKRKRICPGPKFDWNRLDDELKKRGFASKDYMSELKHEIEKV